MACVHGSDHRGRVLLVGSGLEGRICTRPICPDLCCLGFHRAGLRLVTAGFDRNDGSEPELVEFLGCDNAHRHRCQPIPAAQICDPQIVPFWLDQPLTSAERIIFAADPWLQLDRLLGWAAVPIDRLYGLWLPVQSLFLFTVLTQPPSAAKSRALIAYALAWFLLGVVAAVLLSSAGPLFYDRYFGGTTFAALRETLQNRGAWIALAESDRMWASLASGRPSVVAGISAAPSIHVAISAWIYLTVRRMAPRAAPYALCYSIVVWVGSVQLGWHYVAHGLLGALGMLGIWVLSDKLQRHVDARFKCPLSSFATKELLSLPRRRLIRSNGRSCDFGSLFFGERSRHERRCGNFHDRHALSDCRPAYIDRLAGQ